MRLFSVEIQKRFADSDILGHINNVNLQHYLDIGKTEMLKEALGLDLTNAKFGLITASTTTNYLKQTRFSEDIAVETQVEKIGTKSITLFQRIVNSKTNEIKAESHTVWVAFDFIAQQTILVPTEWKEIFSLN